MCTCSAMFRFTKAILPFCILWTLAACQTISLEEEDIAPEKPNGNLVVSISQLEQTPFSSITRSDQADFCNRLNFAIYNPDGSRVKQTNQLLNEAGFGTAAFQLDEGTYQLVVVAHSSDGNPTMTDPSKIRFTNAQGFTDTFLYNDTITIGAEPKTRTLTLHRITALCRFVIEGDIPANVSKMRFYYTGGSGAFNAATGLGSVNSKQDLKFDVTSGQREFDLYTFLHNQEGTIHLKVTALDASGNEILLREFDVSLTQNTITRYFGDFFGGGDFKTSMIDINLNTDWDSEIKITF